MGLPGFVTRRKDDEPSAGDGRARPDAGMPRPSLRSAVDDDPLAYFEEPARTTAAHPARGRGRMLLLAGGAGIVTGLAVVSLFVMLMEGRGTAAVRTAPAVAEIGWQRPVISTKTDLETEIAQASLAPTMSPAGSVTDEAASLLVQPASLSLESGPLESDATLMTRFASLSPDEALQGGDSPRVLDGSIYLAPDPHAPSGNETIVSKQPPVEPVDRTFTLGKNETLVDRLMGFGVSEQAARALVAALEPVYPRRLLRPGMKFSITLDRQQDFYGTDVTYPVYLSFVAKNGEKIIVEADEEGNFVARSEHQAVADKSDRKTKTAASPFVRANGVITSTLYAAARDRGVPPYIISQMLRAFGYGIDLQRQISKGDTFEVLYGAPRSGSSRRRKVLYYAALTLRGKKHEIFRFTAPGQRSAAYYDEKGRAVKQGLMRTPIPGARITSGFGMRRHPILGYTKLHTGVDFGAPRGTPIRAAGDGVVIHAGWRGGYGRTVMIRHDNGYVTLYAHQSRIARGIRKGVRVRQGRVIGYVGSSGRATGPHLHYEVRLGNRPVNPLRVRVATRVRLRGKALRAFERHKARVIAVLRKAPLATRVAARD